MVLLKCRESGNRLHEIFSPESQTPGVPETFEVYGTERLQSYSWFLSGDDDWTFKFQSVFPSLAIVRCGLGGRERYEVPMRTRTTETRQDLRGGRHRIRKDLSSDISMPWNLEIARFLVTFVGQVHFPRLGRSVRTTPRSFR